MSNDLTLLVLSQTIMLTGKSSGQGESAATIDKSLSAGGGIPFTEVELAFNRQDPGTERVAICV